MIGLLVKSVLLAGPFSISLHPVRSLPFYLTLIVNFSFFPTFLGVLVPVIVSSSIFLCSSSSFSFLSTFLPFCPLISFLYQSSWRVALLPIREATASYFRLSACTLAKVFRDKLILSLHGL